MPVSQKRLSCFSEVFHHRNGLSPSTFRKNGQGLKAEAKNKYKSTAYNFIISIGGSTVNQQIEHGKHQETDTRRSGEQRDIAQV